MPLKTEQRKARDECYKTKPIRWEKILDIYISAGYDDSGIFRDDVMKLKYDNEKRKCFELMDKIDLYSRYKGNTDNLRLFIKGICEYTKKSVSNYEFIIDNYKMYEYATKIYV